MGLGLHLKTGSLPKKRWDPGRMWGQLRTPIYGVWRAARITGLINKTFKRFK